MKKTAVQKSLRAALALCMCLAMLAGCGAAQSSSAAPASSTSTAAASTSTSTAPAEIVSTKDDLVVVANQEIVSLDPADQAQLAASQLMVQIYEGLMYLDEKNTPQPMLAESIESVDDVTYKVTLKQGVKFHNGEELKASDVIYSFKRALENPKTATNLGDIDTEAFEEVDDYTLVMKTKTPIATFYSALCHAQASILSQKGVEALGENFGKDASGCGTGAFQFVAWDAGIEVKLASFEDYWGEKAKIKNIFWKFVDDANSRNVMLEAGEADVIYQVQVAGIESLLANEEVNVHSISSTTIRFIYMNQSDGMVLSDKRVRQAISYAIDRDGLVKNVFGEYATPATSFLAPGVIGHTADLETYNYDPEKAKALLAEAGYTEAKPLKIKLSMHAQNIQQSMAEIIQANLSDVGIQMEIEPLEAAAWIAALAEGKTQMGFNTNSNIRADPDALYIPCYSANVPAPNHGCINDPKLDELLVKGRQTFDSAEREKIYVEAQQIVATESYFYPLCYDNITMATRKNLENFVISPTSMQRYNVCYFS